MRQLMIVDDDISRHGLAAIVSSAPDLEVAAALDHRRALVWSGWQQIDVALVDAADERREDDHFPGVAVVEAIRASGSRATVIVLTGHFFDGAIRRRMKEAKAAYLYHRSELLDAAVLLETVRDPRRAVPDPIDPEEEIRHGLSRYSHVNRAVLHALERTCKPPSPSGGNPARAWERLRRDFNREAELIAMTPDGRLPDRRQELPSLPQISRLLQWATRVDPVAAGRWLNCRRSSRSPPPHQLHNHAILPQHAAGRADRGVCHGRDQSAAQPADRAGRLHRVLGLRHDSLPVHAPWFTTSWRRSACSMTTGSPPSPPGSRRSSMRSRCPSRWSPSCAPGSP
ncbi:hypothetical protein AB0C18_14350 [Nonomuraea muscovyensis]|uniref:hypothetical protein n=1 Tax=Nonomuraea muscovyensis TaxID=1124761 RepID=UPI0033FB241C